MTRRRDHKERVEMKQSKRVIKLRANMLCMTFVGFSRSPYAIQFTNYGSLHWSYIINYGNITWLEISCSVVLVRREMWVPCTTRDNDRRWEQRCNNTLEYNKQAPKGTVASERWIERERERERRGEEAGRRVGNETGTAVLVRSDSVAWVCAFRACIPVSPVPPDLGAELQHVQIRLKRWRERTETGKEGEREKLVKLERSLIFPDVPETSIEHRTIWCSLWPGVDYVSTLIGTHTY